MRENFYTFLREVSSSKEGYKMRFSPEFFPHLFICKHFTLIKTFAMPFGTTLDEEGFCMLYGSSFENPIYFFLETLWTRLTYVFPKLPTEIFGEDLKIDSMHPFLSCKFSASEKGNLWNLAYSFISNDELQKKPIEKDWQPIKLSRMQYSILSMLLKNSNKLDESDENLKHLFENSPDEYQASIQYLIASELIFRKKGYLEILPEKCDIVVINGKCYAAENKTGRLFRWGVKSNDRLRSLSETKN